MKKNFLFLLLLSIPLFGYFNVTFAQEIEPTNQQFITLDNQIQGLKASSINNRLTSIVRDNTLTATRTLLSLLKKLKQNTPTSYYVNNVFLKKNEAANTYLKKTEINSLNLDSYLKKTDAAHTYLKGTDIANTYLKKASAQGIYLSIADADEAYFRKTSADFFLEKNPIANTDYYLLQQMNLRGVNSSITRPYGGWIEVKIQDDDTFNGKRKIISNSVFCMLNFYQRGNSQSGTCTLTKKMNELANVNKWILDRNTTNITCSALCYKIPDGYSIPRN